MNKPVESSISARVHCTLELSYLTGNGRSWKAGLSGTTPLAKVGFVVLSGAGCTGTFVVANYQYKNIDQGVRHAVAWLDSLTKQETLRKAGLLLSNSWLCAI